MSVSSKIVLDVDGSAACSFRGRRSHLYMTWRPRISDKGTPAFTYPEIQTTGSAPSSGRSSAATPVTSADDARSPLASAPSCRHAWCSGARLDIRVGSSLMRSSRSASGRCSREETHPACESLSDAHGGLETAVADVERPESIRKLLEEGDVLVSTVGPFTLYGKTALEAALDAGAHYLDSTGEPAFMREVFADAGPVAERLGRRFSRRSDTTGSRETSLRAAAVERAGPDARRVDVGYLMPKIVRGRKAARSPVISTGTRASLLAAVRTPSTRAGRSACRSSLRPP